MRLAIIDIGSNTIKLLVAESGNPPKTIFLDSKEVRLGDGISQRRLVLADDVMQRALSAIHELIDSAKQYRAEEFVLVATSALRDAANQEEFVARVKQSTGFSLRILSGEEEAEYICKGVISDAVLADKKEFLLADLGGGSLELIHYCRRVIEHRVSLQLGAIRLSEMFIADPTQPIEAADANRLSGYVKNVLKKSKFLVSKDPCCLVGAGGALTISRAIMAERMGRELLAISPRIELGFLRELYAEIASMSMSERCKFPRLPESRADIMPAALLILIALAESTGANAYLHSMQNLRFGVAMG